MDLILRYFAHLTTLLIHEKEVTDTLHKAELQLHLEMFSPNFNDISSVLAELLTYKGNKCRSMDCEKEGSRLNDLLQNS